MSWDYMPGKNAEGYPDPTAAAALSNVQRSQRGLQSKRAGEHFENMIAASLGWYKDKGVAFIEKTPEPMRPLRPSNRQGQFLACYIDYNRLTQEQLNSLAEHDRLGAAAFILVSVELQDFYRVPWGVWRDMRKLYGHKHMNKAELEPFRVQYIAGVLKLLEGIELEYGEQEETL